MELNWTTFALEAVNFMVLVWILKRFLYKPVLAAIAQRFSDCVLRDELRACVDVATVHATLTGLMRPESMTTKKPAEDRRMPADHGSRWLCPQEIALELDVQDSAEALHAVSTMIEHSRRLAASPIFRALWRREQAASTGVGNGFAIPHARITGIGEPVTVYVRTKNPIAFAAPDGKPVSELFCILIPAENAQVEHLHLLALVAEAFSSKTFRRRLNATFDRATVWSEFNRWIHERNA